MYCDDHHNATYSEKNHSSGLFLSPLTDFEDGDDFAAMESPVPSESSEWRNVSSSSSSSAGEDELTAKDIVNWRELWEVWTSHHPVASTDIRDIPAGHPFFQDIYSVFQFAHAIPRSRFDSQHSAGYSHAPDALQNFLAHLIQIDPTVLSENSTGYPQLNTENGLATAAVAMEVHQAALRLTQDGSHTVPDEDWSTQVHDTLIVKCARGRLMFSETWTLQAHDQSYPQDDLAPSSAKILSVRRLQPHGAILVAPEGGMIGSDHALPTDSNVPLCFAAIFLTRSQVASQFRDTLESVALHSYSVMVTRTILNQMSTRCINMPVFAVMFDRNIVRFHVDWNMTVLGTHNHISVPLPQTDTSVARLPPFRDFDLTLPQDSLRVAFILDALGAYAQCRLSPAVRATSNSRQWASQSASHTPTDLLSLNQISPQEKVQAWMETSAVAAAGIGD